MLNYIRRKPKFFKYSMIYIKIMMLALIYNPNNKKVTDMLTGNQLYQFIYRLAAHTLLNNALALIIIG